MRNAAEDLEPRQVLHRLSRPNPDGADVYHLLDKLAHTPATAAELASERPVVRPTIVRNLDPLVEADIVTKDNSSVYQLSPVGQLVRQEMTEAAEMIGEARYDARAPDVDEKTEQDSLVDDGRAALTYLSGSDNRSSILRALVEAPRTQSELSEACSVSKSTIHRAVTEFERREWIQKNDSRYEATNLGRTALGSYTGLYRRSTAIIERAPFFLRLGSLATTVPLEGLHNTTLVVSSPGEPQKMMDELIDLTSIRSVYRGETALERIRTITPMFSTAVMDYFAQLVNLGTEIEIIYDASAIESLCEKKHAHLLAATIGAPNVSFRVYPENVTYGFGRYDDAMMITAYDESIPHEASLTSEDDRLVNWIDEWFEECWAQSESPTAYVRSAVRENLSDIEVSSVLGSD